MLVGKNHVAGEGSCWWGRIMLVLQNDEECKNVVSNQCGPNFGHKKINFFIKRTPVCPFAT